MKDLISTKFPVFISSSSTVKIFMIPFLNCSEKIVSLWTFTYLLSLLLTNSLVIYLCPYFFALQHCNIKKI